MVFHNEAKSATCHKCLGSYLEGVSTELSFPFAIQLPRKTFQCYLQSCCNFSPTAKILFPFTCPGMTKALQQWLPAEFRTATLLLFRIWENQEKDLVPLLSKIRKWRSACLLLPKGDVGIIVSMFPWAMRTNFRKLCKPEQRLQTSTLSTPHIHWEVNRMEVVILQVKILCIIPFGDMNCSQWDGWTFSLGAKEWQIAFKKTQTNHIYLTDVSPLPPVKLLNSHRVHKQDCFCPKTKDVQSSLYVVRVCVCVFTLGHSQASLFEVL